MILVRTSSVLQCDAQLSEVKLGMAFSGYAKSCVDWFCEVVCGFVKQSKVLLGDVFSGAVCRSIAKSCIAKYCGVKQGIFRYGEVQRGEVMRSFALCWLVLIGKVKKFEVLQSGELHCLAKPSHVWRGIER